MNGQLDGQTDIVAMDESLLAAARHDEKVKDQNLNGRPSLYTFACDWIFNLLLFCFVFGPFCYMVRNKNVILCCDLSYFLCHSFWTFMSAFPNVMVAGQLQVYCYQPVWSFLGMAAADRTLSVPSVRPCVPSCSCSLVKSFKCEEEFTYSYNSDHEMLADESQLR